MVFALSNDNQPRALEIQHEPQFFIDDFIVDNHWANQFRTESIRRVFHAPRKDEHNPVIAEDGGYVNVVRDDQTGKFRMWYQTYWDQGQNPRQYTYGTAYAESVDGIRWQLPKLGRHEFKGTRDNNIVMLGPGGSRAECQFLLNLPPEHRHGYQYVMLYTTDARGQRGLHLIGSHDGIDWDPASDVRIAADYLPDTQSSIVWDAQQGKFVCFTRATNIYPAAGQRRRIARLENSELWSAWPIHPENILLPDDLDIQGGHSKFYGMPTRYEAGIYWGFLWPYQPDKDICTELAFSRDGRNFQRLPNRPRMVEPGTGADWDRGMVLGSGWVEVGDEWWIYYAGHDGPHNAQQIKSGIGLARLRKEGFVSLRSPPGGGVVVTRLLRWPGGKLLVNADAGQGELTVRVTDYARQPISGFDARPSLPTTGNSVSQEVKWANGDIRKLQDRMIRLEFTLRNSVDLYSFRAARENTVPKDGATK